MALFQTDSADSAQTNLFDSAEFKHDPEAGILLAADEVVKKRYVVSRIGGSSRSNGEGRLTVTDRRIVFTGRVYTSLNSSLLMQEVQLKDVNGLVAYRHRGFSTLGTLFLLALTITGFLLLILGLTAKDTYTTDAYGSPVYISGHGSTYLGWAAAMAVLILITLWICMRQKTFRFAIQASNTSIGPIAFGTMPSYEGGRRAVALYVLVPLLLPINYLLTRMGLIHINALDTLTSYPTAESEQMLYELGAVILTLQARGRFG